MVESAPRFALLRTGETGLVANTAECLGYKEGGNGRLCQLQQREKVSETQVGSALWIRTVVDTIGMERRGEFQNVTVFERHSEAVQVVWIGPRSRNLRQDPLEGLRSPLVCVKGLELPYQLRGASGARSSRWTHQLGVRVTLMRTVVDSRLPIGHKLLASDLSCRMMSGKQCRLVSKSVPTRAGLAGEQLKSVPRTGGFHQTPRAGSDVGRPPKSGAKKVQSTLPPRDPGSTR